MTPVEAWSAVVRGEDAAVFAYSVAGAQVQGGGRRKALTGLDEHRANRDRAAAAVVAAGGAPPPVAAGYQLPESAGTAVGARALMADVDNALVATYADAAAVSRGAERRRAARVAAECAARAVSWGAATQAFPTGSAA